jgi:replicative DNA helicase
MEWLLELTEKFCQEKALHNAILESIHILDEKTDKTKGAIPKILSDALSVSFDPNIGHDYIEDASKRFDFYHQVEKRIPFDLDFFNRITKGGLPTKTLNVALAGTGVGKSLFMCHVAAGALSQNYNVLYITLEMAEEKIAERIDANLLNVKLDDLANLPKDTYERKISRIKENIKGKLIIKEYPTASAGSIHFRTLLNELAIKKNFKPDIVFIDYLNICASARLKHGANVNSYSYIKAIAEEIRGLAVEFKVPIVSATQTTRSGFTNTDPGLEDTSESFGLPATADFMFALITSEELEKLNHIMVKQLKNRYNDPTMNKRFVIGVDRSKMKLYDVEAAAQTTLADSGQELDRGMDRDRPKNKFSAIKV